MGFLEILTLVLIVLKLTGIVAITWWGVFTPIMVGYAVIFTIVLILMILAKKGGNI